MKQTERYGTVLRIYDNGGKTFDRYTILPPRWATEYRDRPGLWNGIGASAYPYHPMGFGMWVTTTPGDHLGLRRHWDELPPEVQDFARQSFPEFAPEPTDESKVQACTS